MRGGREREREREILSPEFWWFQFDRFVSKSFQIMVDFLAAAAFISKIGLFLMGKIFRLKNE